MTKGMNVQGLSGSGGWAEIIANRLHLISFKKGNYLNRARFYISTQVSFSSRGRGKSWRRADKSERGGVEVEWSSGRSRSNQKDFPREEFLFVRKS